MNYFTSVERILTIGRYDQCDQIGRFLKVFGNKNSSKRSPNDWPLVGLSWKTSLLCKNCIATFWTTFGKIGLLFTPTSGHTGCDRKRSFIVLVSVGRRTAITLTRSCSTPKRTFRTARAIWKQSLAFDDARSRRRWRRRRVAVIRRRRRLTRTMIWCRPSSSCKRRRPTKRFTSLPGSAAQKLKISIRAV